MTQTTRIAFITPSYEGDLARCQLLCDSMDRMANGNWCHYVLVADHDFPLFEGMAGPRRRIIRDSQLLPQWLKPVRQPFDKKKRWRWISSKLTSQVWPMTGWHVQQLRKMLIARHVTEDILVMADSDSFFVRPFGIETFLRGGDVRLQVIVDAISIDVPAVEKHVIWTKMAHKLLGLSVPTFPAADYVHNLVSWRRDHAIAMLEHIESIAGCDLVTAMGRHRTFSEYQIYGVYATQHLHSEGHWPDAKPLSLTYWNGDALTAESFASFISELKPDQIAVCVQSFTGTSLQLFKQVEHAIKAEADDTLSKPI